MRFLPIGVPYHSHLLSAAPAAALAAIGSTDSVFWSPSALTCAVFNTEDGTDLRSSPDLLASLFTQIFTSPIFWATKATAFPSSATHALDFGTGGASGIGSLCVRNWEGRGIRTVMVCPFSVRPFGLLADRLNHNRSATARSALAQGTRRGAAPFAARCGGRSNSARAWCGPMTARCTLTRRSVGCLASRRSWSPA